MPSQIGHQMTSVDWSKRFVCVSDSVCDEFSFHQINAYCTHPYFPLKRVKHCVSVSVKHTCGVCRRSQLTSDYAKLYDVTRGYTLHACQWETAKNVVIWPDQRKFEKVKRDKSERKKVPNAFLCHRWPMIIATGTTTIARPPLYFCT